MRGAVLDAAAALFQAQGYAGTSTQDIARTAGVTSGAMHHHFPTKKALGLAVIEERIAQAVRETWIDPLAAAPDAVSGITSVMDSIRAALEARGAVQGCPLNNLTLELSLADPAFRAAASAVFSEWRDAIAARFREDGKSRDADSFATLVVAAYSGAMAMAKAEQSTGPLSVCADHLRRIASRES